MDVGLVIRQWLQELGLEQKDLANAAGVTDSYVPSFSPGRNWLLHRIEQTFTNKMGKLLKLPAGKLSLKSVDLRTELMSRTDRP